MEDVDSSRVEHEGDEDTQLLLFLQRKHLAHLPSILVFVITLILLSPLLLISQLSYYVPVEKSNIEGYNNV